MDLLADERLCISSDGHYIRVDLLIVRDGIKRGGTRKTLTDREMLTFLTIGKKEKARFLSELIEYMILTMRNDVHFKKRYEDKTS